MTCSISPIFNTAKFIVVLKNFVVMRRTVRLSHDGGLPKEKTQHTKKDELSHGPILSPIVPRTR
jgi:hypothetical protein